MQQSVLLSAVRGVDGVSKENYTKYITRRIRNLVLVDARPMSDHSFMRANEGRLIDEVAQFLRDYDAYPVHYMLHLLQAMEVIGYKHPVSIVRETWITAYQEIVHSFHLNIETEEQLDLRLPN
jgi:hypothetical protein